MSSSIKQYMGRFQISPCDRLTISGKPMRLAQRNQIGYVLMAADGSGCSETFSFEVLSRMSANGDIKHEVNYFLPSEAQRRMSVSTSSIADLKPNQRKRLRGRYAFVRAYLELEELGEVRSNDEVIASKMPDICEKAVIYTEENLPDPEQTLRDADIRAGRRAKRRGSVARMSLKAVHPRTLRKWVKAYLGFGIGGLADSISNRGNRNSHFRPEERQLMMEVIRRSYLSLNCPSQETTFGDVKDAFRDRNIEMSKQGLTALRTPSREAVRKAIKGLGAYEVTLARKGPQAAEKLFRPVGRGIEVDRPFQRVEMDEWKIDLISRMADARLLELFSAEELVELGLDNSRNRWWVTVAIDCKTKCILAMSLTRNPKASSALDCLRWTTRDKGEWADAVGAVSGWPMAAAAEMVVTDHGSAFKSGPLFDACTALGIILEHSIAGLPGMRGSIERVFGTLGQGLLPRLNGRTFSSVLERGDHASEDRATLTTEDLCGALVRWVVDIYHNTPHAGLGGRTPLEQWNADHDEGNYPAKACPDEKSDRLAFGTQLTRQASKNGVTVLGVQYHSAELAAFFISKGKQVVEVRWLPQNIGKIEVRFDDEWHTLSAVSKGFDGLHAQLWIQARRALKTSDPKKLKQREDAVFNAIKAIRSMNAQRSLEFGMITQEWKPERVAQYEQNLLSGFEIEATTEQFLEAKGQYGQTLLPTEPTKQNAHEEADKPLEDRRPRRKDWAVRREDDE